MLHSLTACLPRCLQAADVPDEPMDNAAGTRDDFTRASRTSSIRGSQASRSGVLTPLQFIHEILQELKVMQSWPSSAQVLMLKTGGRDLMCRAVPRDRVDRHLKRELSEWQEKLQAFKAEWAQLQTLPSLPHPPTRAVAELKQASQKFVSLPLQAYVDEQLLLARQDIESALDAFSGKRFTTAKRFDETAGEHLIRASQLIEVFSRLSPTVHDQVAELLDLGRSQDTFDQVDRKLHLLLQPGQAPARRPLLSEGQWSVTSAEAVDGPVEPGDVIKRVRALREQAKQLPSSQKLKASFVAQCDVLEREINKGLRSVSMDAVHQQLNALETTLRADMSIRKLRNSAAQQLNEVEAAVARLPSTLHYRQQEAQSRFSELAAAYHSEEYSMAAQIFALGSRINQATLALSAGNHDVTELHDNFQLRNHWVDEAKPWLHRATTYLERIRKDHFEQVLRMMDEATDARVMSKCLYELGEDVRLLQAAAAAPRIGGTTAAWNAGPTGGA